jgi:hypothetical protein
VRKLPWEELQTQDNNSDFIKQVLEQFEGKLINTQDKQFWQFAAS